MMNLVRDKLHLLSTIYLLYKKSTSLKNEMNGPREKEFFTLVVDYLNLKIRIFQTFSQSIRLWSRSLQFCSDGKEQQKENQTEQQAFTSSSEAHLHI